MKKPYQKPAVYAESFELLEHIASCSADPAHNLTHVSYRSGDVCTYTEANVTLFNDGINIGTSRNSNCVNDYDTTSFASFQEYLDSFNPNKGGEGCYNAFGDGNFFAS